MRVNGVYTQRFNRTHNTDGPLFRGRYKVVLIDADSHLLEVLRYIHRNPLRAGRAEQRFYSLKHLPSVMGGDSFKQWVKEKFIHLCCTEEIPESRELALSPEQIIALVCDHFNINKEQLFLSRRGTENLPRDIALYLVRQYGRDTLANVGKHFGIRKYSTVSSAIERVKSRKKTDSIVQQHLEDIERVLSRSQKQTCPLPYLP